MNAVLTLALSITLAFGAPSALAQVEICDENTTDALASSSGARADQILYKGVVGNLLEAVPLEPEQRVQLQRTNAVISNPLSARSLALLLGITNPLVMLVGLAWGIHAASRIESPATENKDKAEPAVTRVESAGGAPAGN